MKLKWGQIEVPVYLNASGSGLPDSLPLRIAERFIEQACITWSTLARQNLTYSGTTGLHNKPHCIVVSWHTPQQIFDFRGNEVYGYCQHWQSDGVIESAVAVINSGSRGHENNFTLSTIMHEMGHAIGIYNHLPEMGSIMSASAMGRVAPTFADMQAIPEIEIKGVLLNYDLSITCPIVDMQDGRILFVHLEKVQSNSLQHSWKLAGDSQWEPAVRNDIRIGENVDWHSMAGQRIYIDNIRGLDFSGRAEFVLVGDTLYLEYAQ